VASAIPHTFVPDKGCRWFAATSGGPVPIPKLFLTSLRTCPAGRRSVCHCSKTTWRIINLSVTGAAIVAESLPPINSLVLLGQVQSRVVRHFDGGFAVQFAYEQIAEDLEGAISAR
jgi:hypothetical protein